MVDLMELDTKIHMVALSDGAFWQEPLASAWPNWSSLVMPGAVP